MNKMKTLVLFGIFLLFMIGIWYFFGNEMKKTQGYTMAVVAGTPFEIKAYRFKNVGDVNLCNDDQQCIDELLNQKADVIITDRLVGLSQTKKFGYRKIKLLGDLIDPELTVIAFPAENKTLRQVLNRALLSIIHDRTYARISRKYYGRDILKGFNRRFTYPDELPATDQSWENLKQSGQIRFAMFNRYPPFSYFDAKNQYCGFDIEIGQAVCSKLGLVFVPIITAWESMEEGLRAKNYDGIWGVTTFCYEWINGEVEFSDPIYISGAQLFVCNDSAITDPEMLQNKRYNMFSLPTITRFFPNFK